MPIGARIFFPGGVAQFHAVGKLPRYLISGFSVPVPRTEDIRVPKLNIILVYWDLEKSKKKKTN